MSIDTIKLDLAKKIIDTQDKGIINHIKAIFDAHPEANWFESLPDDVRASVEQGIEEADRGEGTPHVEVMKKVKKWLKK
jgi:predicted transcriptional regulator